MARLRQYLGVWIGGELVTGPKEFRWKTKKPELRLVLDRLYDQWLGGWSDDETALREVNAILEYGMGESPNLAKVTSSRNLLRAEVEADISRFTRLVGAARSYSGGGSSSVFSRRFAAQKMNVDVVEGHGR